MRTSRFPRRRPVAAARRAGYAAVIAVNAVLLVVVNNLLDWGWLPFLTTDFTRVLPVLNLSLAATVVVNAAQLVYDPLPLVAAGGAVLDVISFAVLVRVWRVYPFDYSAYSGPWDLLTRALLVLALVGTGIAVIVDLSRLARLGREAAPSGR